MLETIVMIAFATSCASGPSVAPRVLESPSTTALATPVPDRSPVVPTQPAGSKPEPATAFSPPPSPLERWTVTVSHHHGLMLGMRLTELWLWPEPFAVISPKIVSAHYRDAYAQPPKWRSDARLFEWDGDRWWINAVGHSLFGSELYLAARRCRFEPLAAVALTAAASTVWEYGYEASGVRPSALDLVYTPLSGLVLGEFRYWVYRQARAMPSGVVRTLTQILMDPLGQTERGLGFPC